MSSIEQRIVQMRFDNSGFQNGISTTLKSLTQLDSSLKMKGATDGLTNVESKMKNLGGRGLSGLINSISSAASKFSALEIAGTMALVNIANKAVNAGQQIVKSFTLDPVIDGFNEYELKMNSISTILTNTSMHGTTLDDVNAALGDLNEYSDKTIYNFAQMTDNIGKATAAGLELGSAVDFVKGMANTAAAFGVDATKMAGATYQMTQALASGVVKAQDWMSMEQAGMGGKILQDKLVENAKKAGKSIDMVGKSFKGTLEQGWLTADIFAETMAEMANDESFTKKAGEVTSFTKLLDTMKEAIGSGWATTFEHIFGNKDQSTALFTSINDGFNSIIGPSADARNNMLEFWNEAGGRDDVITGLSNIIQSLGKGLGAIGKAFSNIFPPTTGQQLVNMSKGFLELTNNFKLSDTAAKNIQNAFEGVFSIVDFGIGVVTTFFGALKPFGSVIGDLSMRFLDVAGNIGEFLTNINDASNKSGMFKFISDGITKSFKFIADAIQTVINKLGDLWNSLSNINFDPIVNFMSSMGDNIGNGISDVFTNISDAINKIDFGSFLGFMAILTAGKGLGIFKVISDTITGFFDDIGSVSGSITDILDGVKGSIVAYQRDIQANVLIKLSVAIGILSASLVALSTINSSGLEVALTGITFLFAELIGGLSLLMKVMAGTNLKGLFSMTTAMVAMSTAILLLSSAVKSMSDLSWDELAIGLAGTVTLLGSLVATTKLMSVGGKGIIKTATSLIVLAGAINVMVMAVKSLSTLKPESLTSGLIGVGVLLTQLTIFMKATNLSRMSMRSSTGILLLATALNVLAGAVRSIATVGKERLGSSLATIGALLLELGLFAKLTSGTKGMISMSTGMILLSTALNIMAGAIRSIAAVPMNELGKSLMGIAGSLIIFGAAARLIPGGSLILTATGITIMAGAMQLLDGALMNLGTMSMEEIGKSLLVLSGALLSFAGGMALMTTGLAGAAAMMVMSTALMLLTPQLMLLAQLSLEQLGIGLLAIAGAFTVLGLAGVILGPLSPVLLALSGSIALFSAACTVAGVGITLFATGLATLAAVGGGGVLVITNMISGLINLLPQLGIKVVETILGIITSLTNGVPQIMNAVGTLLEGVLMAFVNVLPQVGNAALKLLTTITDSFITGFPIVLETGVKLLTTFLEGIGSNIVKIIELGAEVIINFLTGIGSQLGAVIQAGVELAINFINGVADGIRNNEDAIVNATINIMDACIMAIANAGFKFIAKGVEIVAKLIQGLVSCGGKLLSAGNSILTSIAKGVGAGIGQMFSVGVNIIEGLINGIKSTAGRAINAAKSVVQSVVDGAKKLLGIHSPSRVFRQIGSWTVEGFAIGLENNTRMVERPTEKLANAVIDNITKPINALSSLIDTDMSMSPTITPVMDLSGIKTGNRLLRSIIGGNNLNIATGLSGNLSSSIGTIQNRNDSSDIVKAIGKLRSDIGNLQGNVTNINGITYDNGSAIRNTIGDLVRIAKVERRK